MLTVRRQQIEAFTKQSTTDFAGRLCAHIRAVLEARGRVLPGEQLASQVDLGITRGLRFFQTERHVARYVEAVLTQLSGFHPVDDHPAAALQILAARSVSADTRLDNFTRWIAMSRRLKIGG